MINWIYRISIFLNERMRIKAFLPLVLILVYCHNILVRNNLSSINYAQYLFACLFYLSSIILMRICDEYKDYNADIKNFPKRCIPRGAVTLKDIKILFIAISVSVLPILLYTLKDYTLLIIFIIYLFLFAKFFFIPRILEKNIIAALISHNPILLFIHLIVIQILGSTTTENTITYLPIAIFFWIFPLCWEIARKIRLPKNETNYVTYSGSIGHKRALTLLSSIIAFHYILFFNITPHYYFIIIPTLYSSYLFFRFIRFLKNQTDADEAQIIQSYELYTFLSYINIIAVNALT